MSGLTATEMSNCLSVEASLNFASTASIRAMHEHCEIQKRTHAQSYDSEFSERITEVIGDKNDVFFQGYVDPTVHYDWKKTLSYLHMILSVTT